MKPKGIIITIILTMCALTGNCQSVYGLQDYWNFAKNNYPAIKHYNMLEEAETYTLSNAHLTMYPRYDKILNEESINILINHKTLSVPPKPKTISIFNRTMPVIKTDDIDYDNNLFRLNKSVDNLFFSLILIDRKIKLNELFQTQLSDVIEDILSSKKRKVNNKKNLDAIYQLRVDITNKHIILMDQKRIYLNMFSKIVGRSLNNQTLFQEPNILLDADDPDGNMNIEGRNIYIYNKIFKKENILNHNYNISNNDMKVFQVAGINSVNKKSIQQRDVRRTIFKIDTKIEQEKEYSEIKVLRNLIEDKSRKLRKIKENTTVTYVKLMKGEADINVFINSVILYNNKHNTLEAHKIGLLLSLNRFKFLYEN